MLVWLRHSRHYIGDRRQESWSELEDWYLREGVGLIPRSELARDLNRTPDAVHRRLYDLGLHSYQRWGWTLHHVERVAQVPRHRLQTYLERGDLPYLRGSKCVYIDPGDLLIVNEIDWKNPAAELEEAVLQAWRERLVQVLAGRDWRVGRPFRAQPIVRSDRRWSPRLIRPSAQSQYTLKPVTGSRSSDRFRGGPIASAGADGSIWCSGPRIARSKIPRGPALSRNGWRASNSRVSANEVSSYG